MRLCVICDNYATHKHPSVKASLYKNPRITLHFTPTSCSWLNLVEIFFGIITRQAIRRGTFTDVAELQTAIRTYIDSYNERATPFTYQTATTTPKLNVNQSTTRDTSATITPRTEDEWHCAYIRRDRVKFRLSQQLSAMTTRQASG